MNTNNLGLKAWLFFLTLAVASVFGCVLGIAYGRDKDRAAIQELQTQYDILVSRLSNVLPGGSYIEEPKEFNKEGFQKDISSALDAKE
jgi:hypothetical protein